MQKFPIGIQSFKEIRTKNYLYIDKTLQVETLLNSSEKYVFLSRPRRFGKSLLVDTIKHLFFGDKDLFDGLYIQSRWDWQEYPVILLDFNIIPSSGSADDLKNNLVKNLNECAKSYEIELKEPDYSQRFRELILALYTKTNKQVVILIDEYDMPLVNNLLDIPKAEANREVLREFYKTLKSLDDYIKFMFITGVSRFAKMSIFSGLNNVGDISLKPRHNDIVGLTQQDIETRFEPYIAQLTVELNLTRDELLELLRFWYDGYSWTGKQHLYNPLSVLKLFDNAQFLNYWYDTATPEFLIKMIKKRKMLPIDLENIRMSEAELKDFDLNHIGLESLLLQTGYLTIKSARAMKGHAGQVYELTYPNNEVRLSLIQNLWSLMDTYRKDSAIVEANDMREALERGDKDTFLKVLRQIFGRLPFKLRIGQERYYQSLFYMLMTMMGLKMDLERMTSVGIMDGVLELDDKIYVIEFKYQNSGVTLETLVQSALDQINDRKYYESYLAENKQIILLGVGFLGKKEIDMKMHVLNDPSVLLAKNENY
jgi:hypothetical protein